MLSRFARGLTPCSLGLSTTNQQYFSLRTNQPLAISQQYFSPKTNQHQPSATSQRNRPSRQPKEQAEPSAASVNQSILAKRMEEIKSHTIIR
jgi:hypothetical protein